MSLGRMLYLLHEYTGNSLGNNDWMRRQALQVLLYEGICMGVLEYDCELPGSLANPPISSSCRFCARCSSCRFPAREHGFARMGGTEGGMGGVCEGGMGLG